MVRRYSLREEDIARNNLQKELKQLQSKLEQLKDELNGLKNSHKEIDQKTGTLWNPFNWFNDQEIELRKERKKLANQIERANQTEKEIHRKIARKNDMIRLSEEAKKKYLNFNIEDEKALREMLFADVEKKSDSVKEAEADLNKVYSSIQPLISELEKIKADLEKCEDDIKAVQEYNESLEEASNSYERAMIHEECKKKFKESSPRKIISGLKGMRESLVRTIDKFDKRLCRRIELCNRKVDTVIIDGNNLCYKGEDFRGIGGVVALANELAKKYIVIVFFDPSICKQAKQSEAAIRNYFDKKIEVRIARDEADYLILDFADLHKNSFIISNDNYNEFPDKRAKKEDCIIKADIVHDCIIISDLNVKVRY